MKTLIINLLYISIFSLLLLVPQDSYASRVPNKATISANHKQELKNLKSKKKYWRKQIRKTKPQMSNANSAPWLYIVSAGLLGAGVLMLITLA